MWTQTRRTLYAGVLSCVLHIILLGIAASVLVTLPAHPLPQLRVALLQRSVPLPVRELPTAGTQLEPALAPKPEVPRTPRPKPIPLQPKAEKKPTPRVLPRLPKPVAKPQRKPPPMITQEEPPQTALTVPSSQPETEPANEVSVPNEMAALPAGDESTGSDPSRRNNGGIGGTKSNGAGATKGASATPDYNVNPKPPYPLIARRIGAQGEVLLRVLVRQDGSVATVELAQSSGFSLLDESATRTVRDNWRFIPAQLDGTPVESWVEVPIKFVLADS